MGEQLAGGFNNVGRQQLTVEQFDVLDLSKDVNVQHPLPMPDPLLKYTLHANVAAEQVRQHAREESKKANIISQRLQNVQELILSEKEKAGANKDTQLVQLLIQEDIKLQAAVQTMNGVSKDLLDANQKAASVANDVQGLVALMRTSQRAFEKGVDDYVNKALANATVTLKNGSQLKLKLLPKVARDLGRYLKDNTPVDNMMEKRDIKSMIYHEAEQLKQRYRDAGESEGDIAEKNIKAQVSADFRKQELTKQLSRKQVVVVGALRNALAEQHPEALADGNVIKQLTSFANSDEFFNTFVDLMMTQYATEYELAHAARSADVVMDKVVRSEMVLEGLMDHLRVMGNTPYLRCGSSRSNKEDKEEGATTESKSLGPSSP